MLLVEDNADDAELARLAFSEFGSTAELVVAGNGVEALRLLHGSPGQESSERTMDLVLLDLNLPLFDGHEVLRRIRAQAQTRWLPIVVMTSSTEACDINESYRLGANGYFQKPISYHELVETVRTVCNYWIGLNLSPERQGGK